MSTVAADTRSSAAASERVVVLMTPDDKRHIEEKARAAGISVGELMRRASEAYDPRLDDNELIDALLKSIKETGDRILASLDNASNTVRGTLDCLAERRQQREHR